MTHTERVRTKHGIAMALAPSLQRYDFSNKKEQLKEWSKLTYEAAEEFMSVILPELEAAAVKDMEEKKAQALASITPPNSITTVEQPTKTEDAK